MIQIRVRNTRQDMHKKVSKQRMKVNRKMNLRS